MPIKHIPHTDDLRDILLHSTLRDSYLQCLPSPSYEKYILTCNISQTLNCKGKAQAESHTKVLINFRLLIIPPSQENIGEPLQIYYSQ